MIRMLDNLALLKEIDMIPGVKKRSTHIKKMHPEKIVVIRHTSYVYRDVLCDVAKKSATPLDDHIQLGELVDYISINKSLILERIKFSQKIGVKLFDYAVVAGMYFIKIDNDMKYLLQNYQPFLANLSDADSMVHCRLLGDLKIGFY